MNYKVFLLKTNTTKGAVFLFNFSQTPNFRPHIGDVLTNPLTFEQFKILLDEIPITEQRLVRVTNDGFTRITDEGNIRIIQERIEDLDDTTHSYFVTPANNPQRISSYSTNTFDDDQTLRQLFR